MEYEGRGTARVDGDDFIGDVEKSEVEEGDRCRPKKNPPIASPANANGLLADLARLLNCSVSCGSAIDSICVEFISAKSSLAKSIKVGSDERVVVRIELRDGGLKSSALSLRVILCENGLTACKTEVVIELVAEDTELLLRIRAAAGIEVEETSFCGCSLSGIAKVRDFGVERLLGDKVEILELTDCCIRDGEWEKLDEWVDKVGEDTSVALMGIEEVADDDDMLLRSLVVTC